MTYKRVVTLGEVMLRLKSPGFERFFQSPQLEATFGGGEGNVAASLANFGLAASFVTALPQNPIGDAAVRTLRALGVDTSFIARQGERVGIYFLEAGANQRASNVVYDRANSAINTAQPDDFDWDAIFEGCRLVPYHRDYACDQPLGCRTGFNRRTAGAGKRGNGFL